ncbi:MAG TPA: BamA/TamA family outer membrane protein [Thermoanaerobaculaceae bacterium]|nr:BamA/TamA family outer membrane protein [Thermoanaerobaculaceae bacterium]
MRPRYVVPLLVVLVATVGYAQDYTFFGKNKIRYDTFNWKVYPTPHFRISFYDRVTPSLPKIASFAESAYDELARRLNYQVKNPIPLIAFATHAEFEQNNVLVEFIPEGVGAFAVPSRNRMVLPVDLPDEGLQKLIQHELTHVFQFEILFQGRLGKALSSGGPQWFMEGMASYMGNDEDGRARAFMRDAVASDRVPSVAADVEGYFAYRFGHMVFQFVEAEWGAEGLRDFVFEFRNTLGGGIQKTIKRAFDLDVDEFDSRFRAWLRKYYQPVIGDRSEPREFGPAFRAPEGKRPYETSPVASPSGDLLAAFSTEKDDIDVVLLGVPNRTLYRNLTPGETTSYQYLVAQMLSVGPDRGRDLGFSPDGDRVAVFARHERGRVLLLLNALKGGVARTITIPAGIDQAMEPAYSPDGRTIAFHAVQNGHADIFLIDLASEKVTNLTNDDAYDSDPVFTPDGKTIVYSSESAENAKLYEISVTDPTKRSQVTFGAGSDEGACFSRDGKKLFFASDRDQGIYDIYELELATRDLTRLTRVVGSALNPVAIPTRDGERVVYQGFSKGREWLYVTDPLQGKPAGKEEAPAVVKERQPYVPSVTVAVNKDKIEPVKKHKLFIDNAQVLVGVNSDNTVISQTYLTFADNYGDRRLDILLASEAGYSNFFASYANLSKRLQWGVSVFDNRSYYVYATLAEDNLQRQRLFRQTGGDLFVAYPLSIYHRVEGAVGYIDESQDYPYLNADGFLAFQSLQNKIPFVQTSFTGDTTFWQDYGPHGGRRYQLSYTYALDGFGGGSLTRDLVFDARQYVPISQRNEFAFRLHAATASGKQPDVFYFGGLDTLRGFDYDSVVGNRAVYLNSEWRFPLIDRLYLPWLHLEELRGRFFLDVGGAWWDLPGYKQPFRCVNNGQLQDCLSSYGFGISLDLFGLPVNWDFSKQWDFKHTLDKTSQTSFWIGFQF